MADTLPICLGFTLREEGGWSDNPHDPGGCTMHGITLASYRAWKKDVHLTCAALQQISSDDVAKFYEQCFWHPLEAEQMPAGVDLLLFDHAVNTGVHTSIMILQAQIGTSVDGFIGPHTLAALASQDTAALVSLLGKAQLSYYQGLPGFKIFGRGWSNRVQARITAARAIIPIS